jgi:organic radical activating enzyme
MTKIKISELFYSIQGEGRYQGVPSVFLRTFGCNFKCAGFGMPKGELSDEVDAIAFAHKNTPYENYESLPLVSTGCDSYASWDPRFKDLSPFKTVNEIVDDIMVILPFNEWRREHLVITGGEPLLTWQRSYPSLLSHPKMKGLREITFETNGTQPLTHELRHYLEDWVYEGGKLGFGSDDKDREITFSVSAKLSCSGEAREKAIQPDIVCSYEEVGHTYLKFVVATENDIDEALETTQVYRDAGFTGDVYLMPVGGVESVYQLNNKNVALAAMKHGLRYSDRLQVTLWKNQWGT